LCRFKKGLQRSANHDKRHTEGQNNKHRQTCRKEIEQTVRQSCRKEGVGTSELSSPATVNDMQVVEKELFKDIREVLNVAKNKAYAAVNNAMVEAIGT